MNADRSPRVEAARSCWISAFSLLALLVLLVLPGSAAAQSAIEGTVMASGVEPFYGAVTAEAFVYPGCTVTAGGPEWIDGSGWYNIALAGPGNYCVFFSNSGGDGYASEWYSDKRNPALADAIPVGTDEVVLDVNAELEQFGTISGSVTSDFGELTGEVTVEVYKEGADAVASVTVYGPPHDYTVGGLMAGTYSVRFVAPPGWDGQWYNTKGNRAAADPVNVQWGTTTGGTDARLVMIDKPGAITGTVTAADSSELTGWVTVHAYKDCAEETASVNLSGDTGGYAFDNLAPGDYCLWFEYQGAENFASEWNNNKRDKAGADLFAVAGGETRVVDAALERSGGISGLVSSDWGELSGYVTVEVYRGAATEPLASVWISDFDGYAYTVGNLPAGTDYKVRFVPDYSWNPQWHANKTTRAAADPLTVGWGAITTGVNAQLEYLDKPGSISGTVTTADAGIPAGGVTVQASDYMTTREVTINLAAGGTYTLEGLPAGFYTVSFIPPAPYLEEYYDNQFLDYMATWVEVEANTNTPGINAHLDQAGAITGKVSTVGGNPLVGDVHVAVYEYGAEIKGVTASAANGGVYQVTGLPAGDYQVAFTPVSPIYQPQWYNLQTEEYLADYVSVNLNQTKTGIDAVLVTVGSISGRAASATGSPLAGTVNVKVYDAAKQGVVGTAAAVAANGYTYKVSGLVGGTYYVKFEPPAGWSPQWFDRKTTQGAATPVVVIGEQDTPNVDASLESPGVLQGTFTGVPFNEKVNVTVYDENGDYVGAAEASPPAYTYRIELPAGSYFLGLDTTPGNCVQIGGPCQGDLQATVGSGQTTTFDYAVTPWGRISGNISAAASGAFQSYVSIRAEKSGLGSGNSYGRSYGGAYTLDCVVPGSDYKLFFDPQEYRSEWYNDQPDSTHANVVAVAAGQTTGGIDVVLAAGGGISGTVYPEAPSTFTSWVMVELDSAAGMKYAFAGGWNNFTYSFKGLQTGDYTVFFEPGDNHLPMWYQNSTDTPTTVHVTEGENLTGIDTTLPVRPSLGRIVGTVTDGSGASLGGSAWVVVYDGSGNYVASAGIDSGTNGYEVDQLGTGDYFVFFRAESSCPLYVSEWYDNASTRAGATPVHVVAGGEPATANAQLAKLPAPGLIEGDVTLAGKRIDRRTQVQVLVYDSAQSEVAREDLGSCEGHYQICVTPGSYTVKFVASGVGYAAQWYNNKPGQVAADTVVVGAGERKSQIDADLAPRPENRAPVLDAIGNKTVQENQLLQFSLAGSDADGDSLTFSATNLPAWAAFDPVSRTLAGTPGYRDAGSYATLTFAVSDGVLTDSETITITVADKSPFFVDTFSVAGATGDSDWATRTGGWSVGADKTLAAKPTKVDLATVKIFDEPQQAFTIGTLSADIRLAGGRTPGGYIVFAWQDSSHYRYAGVVKGQVVIGQVGTIGATPPGVWTKTYAIGLLKYPVKVAVLGTGVVDLYVGKKKVHTRNFADTPPAGGIGVLSRKSQTYFDNFKAGN